MRRSGETQGGGSAGGAGSLPAVRVDGGLPGVGSSPQVHPPAEGPGVGGPNTLIPPPRPPASSRRPSSRSTGGAWDGRRRRRHALAPKCPPGPTDAPVARLRNATIPLLLDPPSKECAAANL